MWKVAFEKAVSVENDESSEPITTIFGGKPKSGSKKQSTGSDDEDEVGAFRQPKKLAEFMKSLRSSKSEEPAGSPKEVVESNRSQLLEEKDTSNDSVPVKPQRSLEERCAGQICRTWLKHTFLNLGQPCLKSPCARLHEVRGHPKKLYSDFSFKGLSPKQQESIISQLLAAQSSADNTPKEEEQVSDAPSESRVEADQTEAQTISPDAQEQPQDTTPPPPLLPPPPQQEPEAPEQQQTEAPESEQESQQTDQKKKKRPVAVEVEDSLCCVVPRKRFKLQFVYEW